jgi:hypothetical protein
MARSFSNTLLLLLALNSAMTSQPAGKFLTRFLHAVPNALAVDVFADGNTLFTNLAYTDMSNYIEGVPGTYNITIKVAGQSTVLASLPKVQLQRATTFVVFGTPTQLKVLTNNEITPNYKYPSTKSGVRFAHLSPDAPPVTVWLNGKVDIQSISDGSWNPNGAYPYTYSHYVVPAGKAELALSIYPSLPIKFIFNGTIMGSAGKGITFYAMGLVNGKGKDGFQLLCTKTSLCILEMH